MLKRRFAKVSIVAIIFIVASSFVVYGTMIYSTAQAPPEKEPIMVGILDPDYGDTLSGKIMIRAMILHSHPSWGYAVSVLRNGTEISNSVPFEWDSTIVKDGWWNITVLVTDTKGNVGSDEVLVFTLNRAKKQWIDKPQWLGAYYFLSPSTDPDPHNQYAYNHIYDAHADDYVKVITNYPKDALYDIEFSGQFKFPSVAHFIWIGVIVFNEQHPRGSVYSFMNCDVQKIERELIIVSWIIKLPSGINNVYIKGIIYILPNINTQVFEPLLRVSVISVID